MTERVYAFSSPMTIARKILSALNDHADPVRAAVLRRFFKTGKGEYGEGDRFLGVTVPTIRRVVRPYRALATAADIATLLASPWHEARFAGVLLFMERAKRCKDRNARRRCAWEYVLQVGRRRGINSWDLVDVSAPAVMGAVLEPTDRPALARLARSPDLWRRRVAMVATQWHVRRGDPALALFVADILLHDRHDLIHKAVGWTLREVGKHCGRPTLEKFLLPRIQKMPRTMVRYATEHWTKNPVK